MDDVDPDLRVLDLPQLAHERLDRALDVALQDDVQVLRLPGLQVLVERLEGDAAARTLRELFAAQSLGADVCEVLRLTLVLHNAHELAGRGGMVESEHLDGYSGACLLDF